MNQGIPLTGRVKVQNREFVTAMAAEQLLKLVADPRLSENPKARESQAGLETFYNLRRQIQRMFEGAKKRNVEPYAQYICNSIESGAGVTPQIVLYTESQLEIVDDVLYLPWSEVLVAIDGETQLAARFEAAKLKPSTLKQLVDVRVCYGYPLEWARQAFHDLNMLSIRLNASEGIGMDTRDPLTTLTRKIAEIAPFRGRVSTTRQIKKGSPNVITMSALRTSVVCFAEGIQGLKHGTKPVEIDPSNLAVLEPAAMEYYTKVGEVLGPVIDKHDETVITSPPVMAAVGALGHIASEMADPEARRQEIEHEIELLKPVDWKKSDRWANIAGEMRPERTTKTGKKKPGVFSTVGGSKDKGRTVFEALSDPTSELFVRVRAA